mgnify:CR=1 FL=1
MNVYSNKQRWKRVLLVAAAVIVVATLWYSNDIAQRIRVEEQTKVQLWSEAIVQRAELVGYTQHLFEELGDEERGKADRLADAYRLINNPPRGMDLTFVTDYLWSNNTIPVLIFDDSDEMLYRVNVPDDVNVDSLRSVMKAANDPIVFDDVGHTIYWSESVRFSELKDVMQDLIDSFISETVINSASVPVVMTDSTKTEVIRYQRVDSAAVADPVELQGLLAAMASSNDPIEVSLPGEGRHFIYYADSVVLTQLRYYPLAQLILIAVFAFVAYLIFNGFRRAEQDQVWVGMAKETAHQLGTPLSALMAWVEVLRSEGVDESVLQELGKDLDRLRTVTDRFSKIGSEPELSSGDLWAFVSETMAYLERRMPRAVEFDVVSSEGVVWAAFNPALFGWVLENLTKNAVDAMEGVGSLKMTLGTESGVAYLDVQDTGRGMSRRVQRQVFDPGFSNNDFRQEFSGFFFFFYYYNNIPIFFKCSILSDINNIYFPSYLITNSHNCAYIG